MSSGIDLSEHTMPAVCLSIHKIRNHLVPSTTLGFTEPMKIDATPSAGHDYLR
jgi:hypothetical protein